MTTLNIPYVKQYDDQGKVKPLKNGAYLNFGENRSQRRAHLSRKSFRGNQKGHSLIVTSNSKYERVIQVIKDQFGRVIKTVNHYLVK